MVFQKKFTPNVDLAQLIGAGIVSRTKETETQLDIAESEIVNRFHGFGIPTLTFVSGIEGMRSSTIAYLLLYNLMFIVLLLVVVRWVYWGTTSKQLGGVLQRHLVTVMLAIGRLLFGFGTWLVLIIL